MLDTAPSAEAQRRPVSPPGYPLIGHVPLLFDLLKMAEQLRDLGDVVKLRVPPYELYILNHPRDIEELLVDKHESFRKDWSTRILEPILGQGLLINEGASWRSQRRIVQPEFTPKRVESFVQTMAECSDRACARLVAKREVDLHAEMARLALDIAGRSLFGADTGHLAEDMAQIIEGFLRHYLGFMGSTLRLPDWVPTRANRQNARNHQRLASIVGDIIARRRAQGASGNDLLSRLISARDEHGKPMPERLLSDEVITMLLAGHETTALLLSFTLMLLGQNPEVGAQLAAELSTVDPGQISPEVVAKLPYLDAVVRESLRLYPPAYSIGRESLEDVSLGGVQFPRGAQIWLFQWSVQRDPRFYREPTRYRPERWLSDETRGLPRFAYFPFGGGPRVCPGAHFSLVEAKVALLLLLTRLDIRVDDPNPPRLAPGATIRPRGPIRARVEPRR
jgi:cytochrome P450